MSAKSTTVRLFVKMGLKLAPERVDRFAARAFCTPRRRQVVAVPESEALGAGRAGRLNTSDGEVAFWSWGQGPAVLLVHGWEGRAAQWVPMAERLVRSGHRAVMLDLPAHGSSEGSRAHVVAFARAIREVASVVGPLKAIIAHSLGGAATMLAQLEGAGAERIVALAPVAEPMLYVHQAARWLGLPPSRDPLVYRAVEELVGRSLEEVDLRRAEGRLEIPLLVLHDAKDNIVPFEHGRAVAKVSTAGQLERLHDTGHWRILHSPEVIERALEFLSAPNPVTAESVARLRWQERSGTA